MLLCVRHVLQQQLPVQVHVLFWRRHRLQHRCYRQTQHPRSNRPYFHHWDRYCSRLQAQCFRLLSSTHGSVLLYPILCRHQFRYSHKLYRQPHNSNNFGLKHEGRNINHLNGYASVDMGSLLGRRHLVEGVYLLGGGRKGGDFWAIRCFFLLETWGCWFLSFEQWWWVSLLGGFVFRTSVLIPVWLTRHRE